VTVPPPTRISIVRRWLRFNLVGLLGILVQFTALTAFTHIGVPYLLATAFAVELAVLHNWIWHERYTWSDRATDTLRQRLTRLAKFDISNGAVSLIGNLILMKLLVGNLHIALLLANLISVVACSVANFLLGDRFVFGEKPAFPREVCARSR
jgi:putative flippase GtrA